MIPSAEDCQPIEPKDWPAIETVRQYNARLRQTIDEALRACEADDPDLARLENGRLLDVAIEHRLMHVETLCYMLHQLPLERKSARPSIPAPGAASYSQRSIEIPAGTATLGLPRQKQGPFGWDNEFEEFRVEVSEFVIDAHNVTNQEYLRFINEGGYRDRSLWTEDGWNWITSAGHEYPVFWVRNENSWTYRTMFSEIPLPPDWPVYVSHDEASAYARWAGKELPSEAEWHRAACGTRSGAERAYPWGAERPSSSHGNFDLQRWDPVPVGSFPKGVSDFGVADLIGNGWEWTRTPFEPFPGFEPFPFYPGYSANFFDGKHFVMKGGSARTAAWSGRQFAIFSGGSNVNVAGYAGAPSIIRASRARSGRAPPVSTSCARSGWIPRGDWGYGDTAVLQSPSRAAAVSAGFVTGHQ